MRRCLPFLCAGLIASLAWAAGAGAGPRTNDYVSFRTPSKNVFCAYSVFTDEPAYPRCEIRSGIKPMPRHPRSSECT